MSTVDFVVLIVMTLSIALSVLRGLVREVLTIVAWGGAILAVIFGLPILKPVGRSLFANETTADIATAAFLGILTLVLLSIAAHYIGKVIKKSGLGPVDRTLGAVFGAARGALLLCLAFIFIQTITEPTLPDWLSDARSKPLLLKGADKIRDVLPEKIKDMIDNKTDEDGAKVKTELPPEKPDDAGDETDDTRKPAKPPAEGYQDRERGDMDKLIEKNDSSDANSKAK